MLRTWQKQHPAHSQFNIFLPLITPTNPNTEFYSGINEQQLDDVAMTPPIKVLLKHSKKGAFF